MIDYQTFHRIRHLHDEEHLSAGQIAAALSLDERTVGKWINEEKYLPRQTGQRPGKLDPFKRSIVQWLAQHPYTAV
jgi:transposase